MLRPPQPKPGNVYSEARGLLSHQMTGATRRMRENLNLQSGPPGRLVSPWVARVASEKPLLSRPFADSNPHDSLHLPVKARKGCRSFFTRKRTGCPQGCNAEAYLWLW